MMTLPFKGLPRLHVLVPILHLSNPYARRARRKHRLKPRETETWVEREATELGFCTGGVGSFTQLTADLRRLRSADQRRSAKCSQRRSAA